MTHHVMNVGVRLRVRGRRYQDVRNTTAARIHRDVRWDAHDSASVTQKETRDLLARPLDANSAVQVALLNNQGLQGSFEEFGVARAGLVQALRIPNPTVEAALRFTRVRPRRTSICSPR